MIHSVARPAESVRKRARIEVTGRVQGVGFRPFVARLAVRHELGGSVRNTSSGVTIEIEGNDESLSRFITDLQTGTPASGLMHIRDSPLVPVGERSFSIRASDVAGEREAPLPVDLAVCEKCLAEMRDLSNRRYQYPFINCVHCGPRASIITSLPYDRERTTMAPFTLCARCRTEYESPDDRRFHAEATACSECGPRLEWWTSKSASAESTLALSRAAEALQAGGIIAVKGISGFHLMADTTSENAIIRLRQLKRRDAKPLAVMYPNLARLMLDATVTEAECEALKSAAAPIVLVARRTEADIAPSVAMHNSMIGAMLAYAPLHHLLLQAVGRPMVATSANFGEEPIIAANAEAVAKLGALLDGVLMHDREIVGRADDSVVRVIEARALPLRVGRGISPVSIEVPKYLRADDRSVLAMGGHEKAAIALARDGRIHLNRHLGDLETLAARSAYEAAVRDFMKHYDFRPDVIACDMHPDYFSTRLGESLAVEFQCELVRVQHHAAHFYSALLDSECVEDGPVGLCFDGTGWGADGMVWGAEWIARDARTEQEWQRVATMLPIALPGGEACVREPWRVAFALAHGAGMPMSEIELNPDRASAIPEATIRRNIESFVASGRQCISASSMGRLFDGVASLVGIRHRAQYSAQPAMELEFEAQGRVPHREYEVPIMEVNALPALDWRPMIRAVIEDVRLGVEIGLIASAFHAAIAKACARLAREIGVRTALLTGGCFQNRLLAEQVSEALRHVGIEVKMHTHVPPNDGGLAAGQALAGLLLDRRGR